MKFKNKIDALTHNSNSCKVFPKSKEHLGKLITDFKITYTETFLQIFEKAEH